MQQMRARALSVLAVAAVVLSLSGCDKPRPSVTVWSGRDSQRSEAVCWSFDENRSLDLASCVQGATKNNRPTVNVVPGETIGVSVDKAVAAHGWYPTIGEARLTAKAVTGTYFRFALSEGNLQSGPLELRVVGLDKAGKGRGLWTFELKHA